VDPLTHLTTGVICSQLLPAPSRWWAAAAGAVLGLLPDIDYFCIFWDRLAFIRYHRGFTHSLVAVPLFALAIALLGRFLGGPRWFKPLFILGLAVLASHLLLDLATSYGTQILSPFSRRRFSLDWIFIIDPYFTALLLAGAIAALAWPLWGPRLGAGCLVAAGVYLLVCASYHHQALNLARHVFPQSSPGRADCTFSEPGAASGLAALPQPFSCRRWQLIAAGPDEIRQAFVQLPVTAALGVKPAAGPPTVAPATRMENCPVPANPYRDPGHLTIQTWSPAPGAATVYSPEVQAILATFLEFARFPLLCRAQVQGGEQLLEWLDLRFSIPGRGFPFVLQLRLDPQGRLQHCLLGRRG
jgi:inner membrane protein